MFNIKQSISSAKAKAIQTVRNDIKQQSAEWLDTAKKQGEMVISGEVKPAQPQGAPQEQKPESLFSNLKQMSPEEQKTLEEQTKIRLQRLEEELKQYRMQRQQRDQEWVKQQTQIMNPEEAAKAAGQAPPKREVIMPTSKPKGPNAGEMARKQKSGSREVGKQRSG